MLSREEQKQGGEERDGICCAGEEGWEEDAKGCRREFIKCTIRGLWVFLTAIKVLKA